MIAPFTITLTQGDQPLIEADFRAKAFWDQDVGLVIEYYLTEEEEIIQDQDLVTFLSLKEELFADQIEAILRDNDQIPAQDNEHRFSHHEYGLGGAV